MRRALAHFWMLFHWDLVMSGCLVVYSYSIEDGGWAASQGVEGRVQLTAQRPTPYPWGGLIIEPPTLYMGPA